jgi:hypothetical protein
MNKILITLCLLALLAVSFQKTEDEKTEEEGGRYSVTEDATLPSETVYGKHVDVILDERIRFTQSVAASGANWQELPIYSRSFETTKDYTLCRFNMEVPFSGSYGAAARSRMLVLFDDEAIADYTHYVPGSWRLSPTTIAAHKTIVKPGTHTFRILVATSGSIQFPHYNPGLYEHTLKPSMFATLLIDCTK